MCGDLYHSISYNFLLLGYRQTADGKVGISGGVTVSSSTFKNKIHSTGSIGYNYDTLAGGGVTVGYSETDSGSSIIDAINGQASWNANYGFQGSADLSFNPERLGQVAKDSWDYLKQVGKGFTDSMGNAMDDLMNGVGYVFRGRDDEEGSLMQDLFGHTDEYKFKKYWASLSKEEKFNMLAGRFDRKDRQVKPKRYSTDQDNSEIIDPEKFGNLEYLLKYPRKSKDSEILNRKAVLEKAREKLSDKDLDDFYKNNKPKIIEISEKYGEAGVNDFLKGALIGTTGTIAETILSPLEMVSSDMKKKPLSESEKMKATKEFFEGKSDAFIEGYLRANNITEKAIIVGGIYSLAKSVAKSTLASRNSDTFFGNADSFKYKKTFFNENPTLIGKVVVHHAVEQQILNRYPGVVSPQEMHSLNNLRGIPIALNSDIHLSKIRKDWNRFYKNNPNPTKNDIINKAKEIDRLYGNYFLPKR
jgi:hypothetical protein